MSPGYIYRGTEFDAKPQSRPQPVEKPFNPALCGTPSGAWQHRRLKQSQCTTCRDNYNANRRAAMQEKKGSG